VQDQDFVPECRYGIDRRNVRHRESETLQVIGNVRTHNKRRVRVEGRFCSCFDLYGGVDVTILVRHRRIMEQQSLTVGVIVIQGHMQLTANDRQGRQPPVALLAT
jgi:hypothetical protein